VQAGQDGPEQIAYEVGSVMDVPVIEYETDPTNIINTKIQTKIFGLALGWEA